MADAQISLHLRMDRETFLLYESVPVTLTIRNSSGRPIQLGGEANPQWLRFVIYDKDGIQVPPIGARAMESVSLPPAQSVSRTFDLLPFYELRQRGSYRVQALVEDGTVRVVSAPVAFHIVHGREIWSQTVGLPGETNAPPEYRTYSLVTRRDARYETLYVGVKNMANGVVYGMLPLGMYIETGDLETLLDKDANLHVLYRNGPRSFGYVQIRPDAKVADQSAYTEWMSKPHLASSAEGIVSVQGGEKGGTAPPLVLPEAPAPPPKPEKKKHWWWPFGK